MAFVDFNRGELSPNMRYRSDLAAQHRGVERMENMLPTPRGGLVRRPGSQVLELLPPSDTPPAVRMFKLGSTGLGADIPKVGEGDTVDFGDATYDTEFRIHDIPKNEELEILLSFTEYTDEDENENDDIVAYWVNTPDGNPAFLQRIWNWTGSAYTYPEINFEDTRDVRIAQVENNVYMVAQTQIYRIFWDPLKTVPAWSNSVEYKERDVVYRESGTSLMYFECKQKHTNGDPAGAGSAYWRAVYRPYISFEVVSPRVGHELLQGPDDEGEYRFLHNTTWVTGQPYYKGDVIVDGSLDYYECIKNHTAGATAPAADTTNWSKLTAPSDLAGSTYLRSSYAYREETVPREMVAHHNRLIFAGSAARPSTIFGSEVYSYMNFGQGTSDNEPWIVKISGDKVGRILWMYVTDQLYIGTSGGIFAVSGVITPTSFQLRKVTSHASSNIHAVAAAGSIIFFHKDRQTLREVEYADQAQNYRAFDLTVYSNHLFQTYKAVKMVVVNDPMIIIWILREDGTLVSLSYEKTVDMYAFARHQLHGSLYDIVAGESGDLFGVILVPEEREGSEEPLLVRQLVRLGRRDLVHENDVIENLKLDGLLSFVNTDNYNMFATQITNESILTWYWDTALIKSVDAMFDRTSAMDMSDLGLDGDIAGAGFNYFRKIPSLDLSGNNLTGSIPDIWQNLMDDYEGDAMLDLSGNPVTRWEIAECPASWKTINLANTSLPQGQIPLVLAAVIAGGRNDVVLDLTGLGPLDVNSGIVDAATLKAAGCTLIIDNLDGWDSEMVNFSGNGGTGSVASIPCYYNGTITLPENGFSREGYAFVGWQLGDISASPGNSYTKNVQGSVTFNAVWIETNYVTYNANGGTGVPTDGDLHNAGTTVTVKVGTPVKTGHSFAGWTMDPSGMGTLYTAGSTFVMPATAVVLYAKYIVNNYTVTYNSNGATVGTVPAAQTAAYGSAITIGTPTNLHNQGKFLRWNTQANGGGQSWNPGESFTIPAANVTLYAQFTPYAIGDTGPSGGIIVKDFGSYASRYITEAGTNTVYPSGTAEAMRYLELLPLSVNTSTFTNYTYSWNGYVWKAASRVLVNEILNMKLQGTLPASIEYIDIPSLSYATGLMRDDYGVWQYSVSSIDETEQYSGVYVLSSRYSINYIFSKYRFMLVRGV